VGNIKPTILQHAHSDQITIVKWAGVTENDTPLAFKPRSGWIGHDTTLMVTGTPGGATITLKGTLDPTDTVDHETLHKTDLTDLAIVNATGIFAVNEAIFFVKPVRTGGSGTSYDIFFLFGGSR